MGVTWKSWRLKSPATNRLFNSLMRLTTETYQSSATLALCAGNPPLSGIFPTERASNGVIKIWFIYPCRSDFPWWRHQMETFFALLAICAENSPVPGEFPTQRPVTRSVFDLRLNKRLSKQSWGWWFETLSRPLWRHCNALKWSQRKCAKSTSHSPNQSINHLHGSSDRNVYVTESRFSRC